MHKAFLRTVSAAALALAVTTSLPAFALDDPLSEANARGLAGLGFFADEIGVLTQEQDSQIKNVLGSSDSENEKAEKIKVILGMTAGLDADHLLGVDQLDDSTSVEMARLGIDTSAVGNLSVMQMSQIENVVSSNDTDDNKAKQIDVILGFPEAGVKSPLGVQQLRDSVRASISELGADTSTVDLLTVDELSQLELVVSSTDGDQRKLERIQVILAE